MKKCIGRRRLFLQALVILNCQLFEVRQFVKLSTRPDPKLWSMFTLFSRTALIKSTRYLNCFSFFWCWRMLECVSLAVVEYNFVEVKTLSLCYKAEIKRHLIDLHTSAVTNVAMSCQTRCNRKGAILCMHLLHFMRTSEFDRLKISRIWCEISTWTNKSIIPYSIQHCIVSKFDFSLFRKRSRDVKTNIRFLMEHLQSLFFGGMWCILTRSVCCWDAVQLPEGAINSKQTNIHCREPTVDSLRFSFSLCRLVDMRPTLDLLLSAVCKTMSRTIYVSGQHANSYLSLSLPPMQMSKRSLLLESFCCPKCKSIVCKFVVFAAKQKIMQRFDKGTWVRLIFEHGKSILSSDEF